MITEGYIKIHRSMLEWEWHKDPNTTALFLHCILKANWKDSRFQGVKVPRGSFISSISTLAKECGLTIRATRTSLQKLEMTGEISKKSTNKFSLITIVKYGNFQDTPTESDKQATNERQTNDKRATTIEEYKEYTKKERANALSKESRASEYFLPPKVEDVKAYAEEKGYSNLDPEQFVSFYESKDWMVGKNKMHSWRAAAAGWNRRHRTEEKPKGLKNNFSGRQFTDEQLENLYAQL